MEENSILSAHKFDSMGKLEHIISEQTEKETLDLIICVVEFDFMGNIKHIISEVNDTESKVRFYVSEVVILCADRQAHNIRHNQNGIDVKQSSILCVK